MFKIKNHKITGRIIGNNEDKTLCFRQLFKSELEHETKDNESKDDINNLNEARIEELENTILQN